MKRYTQKTPEGWAVAPEEREAALERLAAFENAYQALLEQQEELTARMEPLKAAGRQKSAQFRELLGKKLVNQQILLQLEFFGIQS